MVKGMLHPEDLLILDMNAPSNKLQNTWSKITENNEKYTVKIVFLTLPHQIELGGEKDVNNINKLYIINFHKSRVTKSTLFSNASERLTK